MKRFTNGETITPPLTPVHTGLLVSHQVRVSLRSGNTPRGKQGPSHRIRSASEPASAFSRAGGQPSGVGVHVVFVCGVVSLGKGVIDVLI